MIEGMGFTLHIYANLGLSGKYSDINTIQSHKHNPTGRTGLQNTYHAEERDEQRAKRQLTA